MKIRHVEAILTVSHHPVDLKMFEEHVMEEHGIALTLPFSSSN